MPLNLDTKSYQLVLGLFVSLSAVFGYIMKLGAEWCISWKISVVNLWKIEAFNTMTGQLIGDWDKLYLYQQERKGYAKGIRVRPNIQLFYIIQFGHYLSQIMTE